MVVMRIVENGFDRLGGKGWEIGAGMWGLGCGGGGSGVGTILGERWVGMGWSWRGN